MTLPATPSTQSGILLIDKQQDWTSHDVVARVRRLAGTRKVGHAGTLDPMATGLLVLGLNSSTRLLTYLTGCDKVYEATIRLGASTTTDDAEGEFLGFAPEDQISRVTRSEIDAATATLTGDIEQVPSSVSAIKVNGERAYARVRAGEAVTLAARPVTVSRFDVQDVRSTTTADGHVCLDLDVTVACSSGTYIRAVARDLGFKLGTGGHLTRLRRTQVGPFSVDNARTLADPDPMAARLSSVDAAGRLWPKLAFTDASARELMQGKRPAVPADIVAQHGATAPGPLCAVSAQGTLLGLVEIKNGRFVSLVNFPADETQPDETQP